MAALGLPWLAGCDAMMEPFIASGAVLSAASVPLQAVLPTDPGIQYSDYATLSVTAARARFARPTDVFGNGDELANPAARVRIATSSRFVRFRLQYTDLIDRASPYSGTGVVLVDGQRWRTFTRGVDFAGPLTVDLDLGVTRWRRIELLMPYAASVDLLGVDIADTDRLDPVGARPPVRYVAVGDSITQGFFVSDSYANWVSQLAALKGWQAINIGYGGHMALPNDVLAAAALSPTVGTYLIGYNNFFAQTPLATFKSNFKTAVQFWRSTAPSAKLYCITPTWSPNTNTLTIEQYRQQIRDGLTELADPLSILVEGEALATNSTMFFPDSIHPNDAASLQIATALASVVNV